MQCITRFRTLAKSVKDGHRRCQLGTLVFQELIVDIVHKIWRVDTDFHVCHKLRAVAMAFDCLLEERQLDSWRETDTEVPDIMDGELKPLNEAIRRESPRIISHLQQLFPSNKNRLRGDVTVKGFEFKVCLMGIRYSINQHFGREF